MRGSMNNISRKDERWKYTDLSALVMQEGASTAVDIQCESELCKKTEDGFVITIPDNTSAALSMALATYSYAKNTIIVGKNSSLDLMIEYKTEGKLNQHDTTIELKENAKLNFYKLHKNNYLLSHTFVTQADNSTCSIGHFSQDNIFYREELEFKLIGKHAHCDAFGFYRTLQANEYVDHHVDVLHQASNSTSSMLYKGILENKSRAVFNGRLYVEKGTQKISAYQANHNLLLSQLAEVYSKPELEIYADDVKCKHGASTGQIDKESLFYLQSRGIKHEDAQRMLLSGFIEEVLQRVTQDRQAQVKEWLTC